MDETSVPLDETEETLTSWTKHDYQLACSAVCMHEGRATRDLHRNRFYNPMGIRLKTF